MVSSSIKCQLKPVYLYVSKLSIIYIFNVGFSLFMLFITMFMKLLLHRMTQPCPFIFLYTSFPWTLQILK